MLVDGLLLANWTFHNLDLLINTVLIITINSKHEHLITKLLELFASKLPEALLCKIGCFSELAKIIFLQSIYLLL